MPWWGLPEELLVHVLRFLCEGLCEGRREAKLWHLSWQGGCHFPANVELPNGSSYNVELFDHLHNHLGSKDGRLEMQVYDDGPNFLCDHLIPLSDNPTEDREDFENFSTDRLGMKDDNLVLHSGVTHTDEVNVDFGTETSECCGTITVIGAFLGDAGVRFVKAPPKQLRLSRRIQEDLTIRATFFYRMEKFAKTQQPDWDTLLISTVDLTKPANYTLDSNFNLTLKDSHEDDAD
jgi:hypothetical protein